VDVTVEVGPGFEPGTEPAPNPPAVGHQGGDAVRAELAKIMSDPQHPHHAGYRRHPIDPKAAAYVQDLYKRAYPQQTAPDDTQGQAPIEPVALSQEAREAAEDARELEQLCEDWERDGVTYEAGLAQAKELAAVVYRADPQLYREATRRLGDGMGLRLLRLLRQRVNLPDQTQ